MFYYCYPSFQDWKRALSKDQILEYKLKYSDYDNFLLKAYCEEFRDEA